MIWELHKDGCEYLYDGHELLGIVDPPARGIKKFTGLVYPAKHSKAMPDFEDFETKLEAKAWVESKVKEIVSNGN